MVGSKPQKPKDSQNQTLTNQATSAFCWVDLRTSRTLIATPCWPSKQPDTFLPTPIRS